MVYIYFSIYTICGSFICKQRTPSVNDSLSKARIAVLYCDKAFLVVKLHSLCMGKAVRPHLSGSGGISPLTPALIPGDEIRHHSSYFPRFRLPRASYMAHRLPRGPVAPLAGFSAALSPILRRLRLSRYTIYIRSASIADLNITSGGYY